MDCTPSTIGLKTLPKVFMPLIIACPCWMPSVHDGIGMKIVWKVPRTAIGLPLDPELGLKIC